MDAPELEHSRPVVHALVGVWLAVVVGTGLWQGYGAWLTSQLVHVA